MIEVRAIDLESTVRGLRLQAAEPDVRYRRYHVVHVHPEQGPIGGARRVQTVPPVYRDASGERCQPDTPGAVQVAPAYYQWERDGQHVDHWVSPKYGHPIDLGFRCLLLGAEPIPPDDPDVVALRGELSRLDAEWTAEHKEELAEEDRRLKIVAAAHALDGLPEAPVETECLECGATYATPGHVEAGGMACDRCG